MLIIETLGQTRDISGQDAERPGGLASVILQYLKGVSTLLIRKLSVVPWGPTSTFPG